MSNQFTNPVLGQQYDQGDARVDYAVTSKDTIFGRFSRQDTRTQTPSTFGFRNVPGVSIPLNLGNSSTYAGHESAKPPTMRWRRRRTSSPRRS